MINLRDNIYFKVIAIVIISLLLLIPTALITSLIYERERTQSEAITEVSSKWADPQTLAGPYISIPYIKYVKEKSAETGVEKLIEVKEYVQILPTKLNIKGIVNPEKRNRGIYEIVVYNSIIEITGSFDDFDLSNHDLMAQNINFNKALFVLGIPDLRGVEKQVKLNWNNQESSFNPGVPSNDIVKSGINAPIDITPKDIKNYDFKLTIELKGSQLLHFTPVGKVTEVIVQSNWANPSFNGAFLPDSREVTDSGFEAKWNILHINRNYPQSWVGSSYSFDQSAFGIDLILPVDRYQKLHRTIRYAILFIGFTFIVFFFIEALNKILIHPVQYLLVGVALVVFFTLLLSFSEHMHFNLAFIAAATLTLLLIAGYVKAILRSNRFTLLITGILALLYSFIFVLIQLQDYALLIGSVGVFIILSVVMYISRDINWYQLNLKDRDTNETKPL